MNKEIRNSGETFSSGFLWRKLKIKGTNWKIKCQKLTFFWGNSTSSMQTEGGWNEGGKGPSVYDANTVGRSAKDWQVTNDNYHHYSQDLDLMKEMNMNMYRFQISWVTNCS